jgi:glucokinase
VKDTEILLADVGGTKTRIAVGPKRRGLGDIKSFFNDDVSDFAELLNQQMALAAKRPKIAVFGVAAPVDGDRIELTNRNWSFSREKLKRKLKLDRMLVINDFVAVAHATEAFKPKDVMRIGAAVRARGTRLVCGPGTGFGVSALIQTSGKPIAIPSEGGHMLLSPADRTEARIFAEFLEHHTPPTIEDVLCARGLQRLHQVLFGRALSSDKIVAAAKTGEKDALWTIEHFQRLLGRVVRDFVLTFDAHGGAFIAGGVGRGIAVLMTPVFREAFETHPRFGDRLKKIPTYFVVHPAPGLLGALAFFRRYRTAI